MNPDDSMKPSETVVHVPFWVVVLVSGFLVMSAYALCRFLMAGDSF